MKELQEDMNLGEASEMAENDLNRETSESSLYDNKETGINGNASQEQQVMQQMERQLTQHLDQYVTLASNVAQEVDERRKNRTLAEFKQAKQQTFIKRTLWVVFLLLCCVVAYFLYSMQYEMMAY